MNIWILSSGLLNDYPDCGGYYSTPEQAFQHPVFSEEGIEQKTKYDYSMTWNTAERWIRLYRKTIDQHYLPFSIGMAYEDLFD